MTAQEKQAVINQLILCPNPVLYYEDGTEYSDEGCSYYNRIVFDTIDTDLIAYVAVDIDDLEYKAIQHGLGEDWKLHQDFLKIQFFQNLEFLNVIEP
jgi:hypothetical protein